MNNDEYLTIAEASKIVRVHPQTLRKFIRSGKLKALKPAWRVVIAKAELEDFMSKSAYVPKVG